MNNTELPVEPKKTYFNPSFKELRQWTFDMPSCRKTEFGAPNVQTKVLARSKDSTYILSNTPKNHSDQTMSLEEGLNWADKQNQYIKNQEMLVIELVLKRREIVLSVQPPHHPCYLQTID